MEKIKVTYYKTVAGRDVRMKVLYFDTLEQACDSVSEWESRTLDNYALFG